MRLPRIKPREILFTVMGTAILYHEVWQTQSPSPLLVFTAIFLYGLIPAFRADEGATSGPLTVLLQALVAMGAKAPPAAPGTPGADPEGREVPAGREAPAAAPEGQGAQAGLVEGQTGEPERSPPQSEGRESGS